MNPQFPADRQCLVLKYLIAVTGTPTASPAVIDFFAQGIDPILRKSLNVIVFSTFSKSDSVASVMITLKNPSVESRSIIPE